MTAYVVQLDLAIIRIRRAAQFPMFKTEKVLLEPIFMILKCELFTHLGSSLIPDVEPCKVLHTYNILTRILFNKYML